ncbi:glycoside hydrolase family 16 protein [Gordonia sp. zg691]|uniref:Glycoside hydrolase family 16 protein n=1 Tax=Gordonia jinghuaiqii TaxID=2758710 RepID=A0A7D7QMI5_9ACTN|nr:glycoside hydrolase family 16 protein [Gordonia jinghuaiqii]MBD0860231.1 glycoside hydrolase family 16 protein [Gordonia jinghuaiqii]MCR5977396.1 family 16 glycosylhydrolase [Gordonia jinghuaiqii]QMT00026.1 glycoside hydrolase family 16 protein [Gordonia jinghuaiqii]
MRRLVHLCVISAMAVTACNASIGHAEPDRGPSVIYVDEFDGPARKPSSPWRPVTGGGGWGNDEDQVYTDSFANVRVDGKGHLAITVRRHKGRYTSARISTKGKLSVTYGRVSARIAVPAGTGLHPAFWMLGDDIDEVGWPASGEIDIIETLNQAPEYHIGVHVPRDSAEGRQAVSVSGVPRSPLAWKFHTYWVNKLPDRIEGGIDDQTLFVAHRGDLAADAHWVFDKPFHLLLNVAVGGRWPGPTDATTPAKATMLVDWVRVIAP